jgi:hypothetical protein
MTSVKSTTHEPNTDRINVSIDTCAIGWPTALTKDSSLYHPRFTFTSLYVQMIPLVHHYLLEPITQTKLFKRSVHPQKTEIGGEGEVMMEWYYGCGMVLWVLWVGVTRCVVSWGIKQNGIVIEMD